MVFYLSEYEITITCWQFYPCNCSPSQVFLDFSLGNRLLMQSSHFLLEVRKRNLLNSLPWNYNLSSFTNYFFHHPLQLDKDLSEHTTTTICQRTQTIAFSRCFRSLMVTINLDGSIQIILIHIACFTINSCT